VEVKFCFGFIAKQLPSVAVFSFIRPSISVFINQRDASRLWGVTDDYVGCEVPKIRTSREDYYTAEL
jgi:hypothetical protein